MCNLDKQIAALASLLILSTLLPAVYATSQSCQHLEGVSQSAENPMPPFTKQDILIAQNVALADRRVQQSIGDMQCYIASIGYQKSSSATRGYYPVFDVWTDDNKTALTIVVNIDDRLVQTISSNSLVRTGPPSFVCNDHTLINADTPIGYYQRGKDAWKAMDILLNDSRMQKLIDHQSCNFTSLGAAYGKDYEWITLIASIGRCTSVDAAVDTAGNNVTVFRISHLYNAAFSGGPGIPVPTIPEACKYPLAVIDGVIVLAETTPLTPALIGQQLAIHTEVQNPDMQPVNYTYITEAIDGNGYTTSIETLNSTLSGLEVTGLANKWIPQNAGNYTLQALVVTDLQRPSVLAEPQALQVKVTS